MEKYRVEYSKEAGNWLIRNLTTDRWYACLNQGAAICIRDLLNSLSTRIEELDEQITVFSGLEDGSCPELIEWFENNLCNVENPSDDVTDKYWPMLCQLEDSHMRLTAELKASNRRFEGLEYSGNPRDWMLHLTAEIERLRGALGFYADEDHATADWVYGEWQGHPEDGKEWYADEGRVARQALDPASPQGEIIEGCDMEGPTHEMTSQPPKKEEKEECEHEWVKIGASRCTKCKIVASEMDPDILQQLDEKYKRAIKAGKRTK